MTKSTLFHENTLRRESLRYKEAVELAEIRNMSAYIRKMCIDGYIIHLQIPELAECAKLLRHTVNRKGSKCKTSIT